MYFTNITQKIYPKIDVLIKNHPKSLPQEIMQYPKEYYVPQDPPNRCHTYSQQVYAVVVASPPEADGSVTTAAVSYTCGFYHIPVICTHSRDSGFSNKVSGKLLSSRICL